MIYIYILYDDSILNKTKNKIVLKGLGLASPALTLALLPYCPARLNEPG